MSSYFGERSDAEVRAFAEEAARHIFTRGGELPERAAMLNASSRWSLASPEAQLEIAFSQGEVTGELTALSALARILHAERPEATNETTE